jgi:hypothetical protein
LETALIPSESLLRPGRERRGEGDYSPILRALSTEAAAWAILQKGRENRPIPDPPRAAALTPPSAQAGTGGIWGERMRSYF